VSDDSPKTRKLAAEVLERWEPAPGAARS